MSPLRGGYMNIEETYLSDEPSSMDLLINDMASYQVLSSEKQLELFKKYEVTKDPKIKELLINSNLPLVLNRARRFILKYNKANLLLNDIFQEGAKGLVKAFNTFDYHKGVLFSTYAQTVIDNEFFRLEFCYDRIVNLPFNRRYEISVLHAKETALTMKLGRNPTIKELASCTNFSEQKVIELRNDYQEIMSLNEKVDTEDSEISEIINLIPSEDEEFLKVEEKSINQELEKILFKSLSDRELMVIILRYGLAHEEALTMQRVADFLHCKRQRISAIEINALSKLKYYYEKRRVKNFSKNATIRDYITIVSDEDLRNIINNLTDYDRELLAKRYNENLTEIINREMTLREFRYIFRVIVPKINYEIATFNERVVTLTKTI